MFERYTEKARRVIFFARKEASELGGMSIEPHHIMLGLFRDNPAVARFCNLRPASLAEMRATILDRTGRVEKIGESVDMPLSPQAKKVLDYAAEESQQLNHRHIGVEHLLLGLLRDEETLAAEILIEHGAKLEAIRDELIRGANQQPGTRTPIADEAVSIEELKRLAAEARNLANAMVRKAAQIEAMCDRLDQDKSDTD